MHSPCLTHLKQSRLPLALAPVAAFPIVWFADACALVIPIPLSCCCRSPPFAFANTLSISFSTSPAILRKVCPCSFFFAVYTAFAVKHTGLTSMTSPRVLMSIDSFMSIVVSRSPPVLYLLSDLVSYDLLISCDLGLQG